MGRVVRCCFLFLTMSWFVVGVADDKTDPSSDRFYGTYTGQAQWFASQGKRDRNLSVEISPIDSGFRLIWTTTTIKNDGREKTKRYDAEFVRDTRPNLYRLKNYAALAEVEPADNDDQYRPHSWAHIKDDIMTVQLLLISDDGGYEMQTYVRQLIVGGMDLTFVRVRDGVPYKVIEGRLKRTANLSQSEEN